MLRQLLVDRPGLDPVGDPLALVVFNQLSGQHFGLQFAEAFLQLLPTCLGVFHGACCPVGAI